MKYKTSIKINIYHLIICIIWLLLGIAIAYIFYELQPTTKIGFLGMKIKRDLQPFPDFIRGFLIIYYISGCVMRTLYWKLFNEHERLKIEKDEKKSAI